MVQRAREDRNSWFKPCTLPAPAGAEAYGRTLGVVEMNPCYVWKPGKYRKIDRNHRTESGSLGR